MSFRDHYYILNDSGEPVPAHDITTWGKWHKTAKRHVAEDHLPGGVRVSTVFLGIDHRFGMEGPPVLWETMIFGGPHGGYQERYTSKADAIAGHLEALRLARTERPV